MKDKIHTEVNLHLDDVTLSISVKENLKKYKEKLVNFGYIEVSTGTIGAEECFWDNINFFLNCGKKEFKKECSEELERKGFNWKQTYKTIKKLLKRAEKLNLITVE